MKDHDESTVGDEQFSCQEVGLVFCLCDNFIKPTPSKIKLTIHVLLG
jgi:hypothetical protein